MIADKPSSSKNQGFPKQTPEWGSCRFVFGNEQNYDWLVVYDDFVEKIDLNCRSQNTLLVTLEPSSIKTYESAYIPGKIHSQPALFWYYGTTRSYDQIAQKLPQEKTLSISTVTSSKHQRHTLHKKRNFFIEELHKKLPQLDRFGRGIREIKDKADALDHYKYHIAVENHRCDHWWTEKLSDAFLGLTLPFYYGAPNASEYFPSESFIEIDINDPVKSSQIISIAMKNNEYEKRLKHINKSRQFVLDKYNFYATISKIIEQRHLKGKTLNSHNKALLSRNELRKIPNKLIVTL